MKSRRRAGKRDNNHQEIFSAIRQIVPCRDLADAGDGVPDGIAWINGGWQLFDVKNLETAYGRSGLNSVQEKWASAPGGPVYLIHTVDEAVQFAQGQFTGIQRFPAASGRMTAADYTGQKKRAAPKKRPANPYERIPLTSKQKKGVTMK